MSAKQIMSQTHNRVEVSTSHPSTTGRTRPEYFGNGAELPATTPIAPASDTNPAPTNSGQINQSPGPIANTAMAASTKKQPANANNHQRHRGNLA